MVDGFMNSLFSEFSRVAGVAWRGMLLAAVLGSPLALVSCAEAELGAHMAKSAMGSQAGRGEYKVGKPYQIAGVWYYPRVDENYDATGIASWYGPKFHGRSTANGETFNQNAVTAAHPTLPMPSLVRVTNLENGRSLVVRVNDRGPFAHGREIDLSRRAAELLGFVNQGTAKVRVQYVGLASAPDGGTYQVAALNNTFVAPKPVTPAQERFAASSAPVQTVDAEPLAPPPGVAAASPVPVAELPVASAIPEPAVTGQVELVPVRGPNSIFVQAGAFRSRGNAEALKQQLASLGPVDVMPARIEGEAYYRVRIGPLADVGAADDHLERVIAQGFPGARIVID